MNGFISGPVYRVLFLIFLPSLFNPNKKKKTNHHFQAHEQMKFLFQTLIVKNN